MSRSISVVTVAAALVMTPYLHAAGVSQDRIHPREDVAAIEAPLPEPVVTLAAMFATAEQAETIELLDGVASGMGALEVVVARIDKDGKLVYSCVDNPEAAQRFLVKPLDKLATKEAKEQ
jgi:hypothetical protein